MVGGIELKRPDDNYKIRMTEWISNNIFGNAYDAAYSEAQHKKFEQDEIAYKEAKRIKSQGKPLFFMGLPPTGDPYKGH